MYIVFLGAPGSGKGTQAIAVAQKLGLAYFATGDLFRQEIERETELGLKVKSYVESGQLVPDEITIRVVLEHLSTRDARDGAILDGFPRNLEQAQALDEDLAKRAKTIDKVIFINLSQEGLLKRLSGRWTCPQCQAQYHATSSPPKVWGKCDKCGSKLRQRPDDAPQTVKRRLGVYFAQTTPLIDYYIKQGKLVEVDGDGNISEVSARITQVLKKAEFVAR